MLKILIPLVLTLAAPKPHVVTITAHDYAFTAPDTVSAGLTTLRLVNAGPGEMHHMFLVRLDEGKTPADFMEAMKSHGPLPTWAHEVPAPNAIAPKGEANTTTVLVPGTYVLTCLIPSPDGTPHVAKGMFKAIAVVPAKQAAGAVGAELPEADVELKLMDYGFEFSKPLTAGSHTIRVRNVATTQSHEVVLARLAPGKTLSDLLAWVEKMQGEPAGMPLGGIVGLVPNGEANFDVTIEPGEYALLCFVPDHKDGKPHIAHGMATAFTVAAANTAGK